MIRLKIFWTLLVLGLLPVSALAGVPEFINYQGQLLDSDGNPLGGGGAPFCFRFSIYDDLAIGLPDKKIWPEGDPVASAIEVKNGVFNADIPLDIDLGAIDSRFLFMNVEVAHQVNESCAGVVMENLEPRQRLGSSIFALNAGAVSGFPALQVASGTAIPVLTDGNLILGGDYPSISATGTNPLTLQGGNESGVIIAKGNLTVSGTATARGLEVLGGETKIEISNKFSQKVCHSGGNENGSQSVVLGGCLEEEGGGGTDLNNPNLLEKIVAAVKDFFRSLGILIENGIATVRELFAEKVTVKKLEISEKVQFVDQATGEIYCVWLENGEWQKVKSKCGEIFVSTEPELAEVLEIASGTPEAILGTSSPAVVESPVTSVPAAPQDNGAGLAPEEQEPEQEPENTPESGNKDLQ